MFLKFLMVFVTLGCTGLESCKVSTATAGSSSERSEETPMNRAHKFKQISASRLKTVSETFNWSNFEKLLHPILIPRVSGSDSICNVRNFITKRFEGLGWTVELDKSTQRVELLRKDIDFVNIIATFNPAANKKIILACHYDSKYMPHSSPPFIGATDSAVPCAMLLDIATALNKSLWRQKEADGGNDWTVQMIFFDGEEAFGHWSSTDSLYGSRHLAEKWSSIPDLNNPGHTVIQSIKLFVLLDLIGYPRPSFPSYFSKTHHFFDRLVKTESRLRHHSLVTGQNTQYFLSQDRALDSSSNFPASGIEDDHKPFLTKGVPVLHVIPFHFPPVWHKSTDNKANLDPHSIGDLSKIFRTFLTEFLRL